MIVSNVVEVHTGREVAIYNNGGTTLKSINLHGNGLIGYVNKVNNNRYYYVKDHLGSIRQVIYKIAAWANDNIVASKNYQPYGSIIAEYNSGTDYRYDFTEKQRDKETDFNYFGARYYDSEIGRWTTVDPLAHIRPGLSPYQYVQNNPLNRFDPKGMLDEGEEDEEEKNWLQKLFVLIGQLISSNESEGSQSGNPIFDSDEMKGIQKVAEVSEKAKQNVVKGIDNVHDAASTTSGAASGVALLTIYEPTISGGALTVSMGSGLIAGSASLANYLITGESSYGNRAAFEFFTLGIGARASSAVKAGKTLTPENVIYLRNTISGGYGSFIYGTGMGFGF